MASHPLPARLDTAAAPTLAAALKARIANGEGIDLHGGEVELIGQACLQVLAAARRSARANGQTFFIAEPSDALADGTALAGMGQLLKRAA